MYERNSRNLLLEPRHGRIVGSRAQYCRAMPVSCQINLAPGFQLSDNLIEAFFVVNFRGKQNLLDHPEHKRDLTIEHLRLNAEHGKEAVSCILILIYLNSTVNSAASRVNLIEQLAVGIILRVHIPQHTL